MRSSAFDRGVIVDTSAFFPSVIRRDSDFAAVSSTMERLILARQRLITSNFILAELHGLMMSRASRALAFEALTRIKASQSTTVVRVEQQGEDRAWAIITHYDDKDFSLADATSFAIKERLGLQVAFTLDRHFAQFGWEIVPLAEGGVG